MKVFNNLYIINNNLFIITINLKQFVYIYNLSTDIIYLQNYI